MLWCRIGGINTQGLNDLDGMKYLLDLRPARQVEQEMIRPPRQPVDLQSQTRFVKERVERAIAELEQIVQQTDPIFSLPRDVAFGLWLAEREIVNAYIAMKTAWWP
jgi:hypothetical protein